MYDRERGRNRSDVTIALMDGNVGLLNTLRSSIKNQGYRQIAVYRNVAELEGRLHGAGFDLIIGDANSDDDAMLDFVRRVRAGNLGRNPFTAVIVTTWNSDWSVVRRAVDAGVDDILVNPISPGKLFERIQQIVENRKPFIVTADYTGPERRRDSNRVSTLAEYSPTCLSDGISRWFDGSGHETKYRAGIGAGTSGTTAKSYTPGGSSCHQDRAAEDFRTAW